MAVPIALRATVALTGRARTAALFSLVVVLTTLALTYSRGGLLVLVLMVGVLVAVGPDRLKLLAVGGMALLGAAPAVLCVLLLDDLRPTACRHPRAPAKACCLRSRWPAGSPSHSCSAGGCGGAVTCG